MGQLKKKEANNRGFQKAIRLRGVRLMPKRRCDACGKEKDVSGGKTCENGHFIC